MWTHVHIMLVGVVDTDVSILCCMFVDRQRQFTIVGRRTSQKACYSTENEWNALCAVGPPRVYQSAEHNSNRYLVERANGTILFYYGKFNRYE